MKDLDPSLSIMPRAHSESPVGMRVASLNCKLRRQGMALRIPRSPGSMAKLGLYLVKLGDADLEVPDITVQTHVDLTRLERELGIASKKSCTQGLEASE